MEKAPSFVLVCLMIGLGFVVMGEGAVTLPKDTLMRQYYKKHNTCENVEAFVKHQMGLFMKKDASIAPKLARLLYSDCFVTGCDGSVLLNVTNSERSAPQNLGLGGLRVIDKIKTVLESRCPGVVSCADILNLAARDAIALAGGPSYIIRTGRKDGFSSKASTVDLPSPSISSAEALSFFQSKGLDVQDMATLLGLHSMGSARCRYIMDRLYDYKGTGKADPSMDPSELAELRAKCPKAKKKGEHEGVVPMNPESKGTISNSTYARILSHKAVLGVDQQLVYNSDTMELAREFSANMQDFKLALALSMARMGEIGVLTGSNGEIRAHCAYTNKDNPYLN